MIDIKALEDIGRQLLEALGEHPDEPRIKDTPARFARWWAEFIDYRDEKIDTTFDVVRTDQMVVLSGVRVWSLCEHHLLPFYCDLSIGYLTGPKLIGLSKLARIAHRAAHKLQVQERLCQEIADAVTVLSDQPSVAVIAQGEHLCLTMRGIKSPGVMSSSVMTGSFRSSGPAREEFFFLTRPK
jgi:GTP cyclohydrolase I